MAHDAEAGAGGLHQNKIRLKSDSDGLCRGSVTGIFSNADDPRGTAVRIIKGNPYEPLIRRITIRVRAEGESVTVKRLYLIRRARCLGFRKISCCLPGHDR